MDRNDVLKSKKAAVEELAELAKSGEDAERMEELKAEIRAFDARIEAFDIAEAAKKDAKTFTPELVKEDRAVIEITGGPATNRTYAGMFNGGRALEIDEEAIRAFRASMVSMPPSAGGFSIPEPLAAQWLDEEKGILSRVGLHCAPLAHRFLHTFPAGTIRFATSPFTTSQDIETCIEAVKILAEKTEKAH